jgi:hypothetical protein
MNRGAPIVLSLLLAALSQPAFTAEPAVDAEVNVSAVRKLAQMRKEIQTAEDRFLAKYNELNQERQYAIKCNQEAFTGSKFYRRVCRPEFVSAATRDEAVTWVRGNSFIPSALVMESKQAGFRQNMIALAEKSPELRRIAKERGDLEKRYEELLRRTVTGDDAKK